MVLTSPRTMTFLCLCLQVFIIMLNQLILVESSLRIQPEETKDKQLTLIEVPSRNHDNESISEDIRNGKFVSVFTIINFANLECGTGTSAGLCMGQTECSNAGGSKVGSCAANYGTCCFKAITCGGSSSQNITWIRNDEYPGYRTTGGTCSYSITRGTDVCKLRLDFDEFELSQPSAVGATAGMCLGDTFTVPSGTSVSTFQYLCGSKPPVWHYYLDVKDGTNPVELLFNLDSSLTQNRRWNIKVTQIPCDQYIPQGCGQYFTGTSGDDIYSFNWNNGMYLHGMNYNICYRKEKNHCTYTYADQGPSHIACPDTFRIPIGTPTTGANPYNFCLFPIAASTYPSTITTPYNGPMTLHFDTTQAVTLLRPLGPNPGFHFTWMANANSC